MVYYRASFDDGGHLKAGRSRQYLTSNTVAIRFLLNAFEYFRLKFHNNRIHF